MSKKNSDLNPKIYNSALKLLGNRAHGKEELRNKLLKKGDDSEVDAVIRELLRKRYLDDLEFAYLKARSSLLHKRWGMMRIRLDLKNLGVDDKIIEMSLERAGAEVSEEKNLTEVIRSYQRLHGEPASIKEIKRLFDHCIRLGYPPEMVRDQLDSMFETATWD